MSSIFNSERLNFEREVFRDVISNKIQKVMQKHNKNGFVLIQFSDLLERIVLEEKEDDEDEKFIYGELKEDILSVLDFDKNQLRFLFNVQLVVENSGE